MHREPHSLLLFPFLQEKIELGLALKQVMRKRLTRDLFNSCGTTGLVSCLFHESHLITVQHVSCVIRNCISSRL